MIELTKYAILVISAFTIDGLEGRTDVEKRELGRILNLRQAIVFVILDDTLALTPLEECGVREDQLASFELSGVGR